METSSALYFLIMIFVLNYYQRDIPNSPIVNIPELGRVLGSQMSSASGRKFQAFRGIPYAEPPVGDLRFNDPVKLKSWGEQVLDATKEGPACLQVSYLDGALKGQEDCLILNVYTPSCNFEEDALPVVVWIHGGGFFEGSGNGETDLYGPHYILDRDVVLVTFNYRLGSLGFLSTNDAEAPGNYGLLDQTLTLKWVRDNIAHFGGNPNSVTIAGHSAGAAGVEFQMLSPHSKGLFHRAIAQSGSSLCSWSLPASNAKSSFELATHFNCSTFSSQDLVKCLRQKDGKEITQFKPKEAGMLPILFGPRIDTERHSPFLPDLPENLIARQEFNIVPYIGGMAQNEGALLGLQLLNVESESFKRFKRDPIQILLALLNKQNHQDGVGIANKLHQYYFQKDNKTKALYQQFGIFASDYIMFRCIDKSVELFSRHSSSDVYYYFYTHQSRLSHANLMGAPSNINFGVVHGDELLLMFKNQKFSQRSDSDVKVSNMLLDLWTSFASNGVPQSRLVPDVWQPTKHRDTRYLKIDSENPTLVNSSMPFKSNIEFLDELLGSTVSRT